MNGQQTGPPIFTGLEPPEPPPSLRHRVLPAAEQALGRPAAPDIWARLWQSGPLRLAWGTCVLALIAGNVVLPSRPRPAVGVDTMLLAHAAEGPDRELAEIARLPRLLAGAVPELGRPGGPVSGEEGEEDLPRVPDESENEQERSS